jgi:hypothetical protein
MHTHSKYGENSYVALQEGHMTTINYTAHAEIHFDPYMQNVPEIPSNNCKRLNKNW